MIVSEGSHAWLPRPSWAPRQRSTTTMRRPAWRLWISFQAGRFRSIRAGPRAWRAALGGLISRVQATPPFPMLGSFPEMIGSVLAGMQSINFFAAGQLDPHAEGLARIFAALSWDTSSLVSCHNDPNPRNICSTANKCG